MITFTCLVLFLVYISRDRSQRKQYDNREVRDYYASECEGCEEEFPIELVRNHREGDLILCIDCKKARNRKKNKIV